MARWQLKSISLDLNPFLIVGILNLTPDSFYDGGKYSDLASALDKVDEIITYGDIIDVGGESTRPYSKRISALEEKQRVMPVLDAILEKYPQAVVSLDTYRSEVAKIGLDKGVQIINDVSGFEFDPVLLDVILEYQPGYVLMHSLGRPENMQDDPKYDDVIDEIKSFFVEKLNVLVKGGLDEEKIVLDPGIGFGKLLEHNLTILARIEEFFELGRPIFLGLSNKSMWEKLLGLGLGERQVATQVGTALMAAKGVAIHRVHEVKLTRDTLTIVQALKKVKNSNGLI